MTMMDVTQAIRARRSIRRFLPDRPIREEHIELMLEAARLAPSGGNGQGWIFGVVTDREQIARLAEAGGNQEWIATAPLVFALCARLRRPNLAEQTDDDFSLEVNRERFTAQFIDYLRAYPDQKPVSLLFENSVPLIPGEHIALVAASLGLGSCWIGYLNVAAASAILQLPPDVTCLFLLPVGYPDPAYQPRPRTRKPLADVTFRDRWPAE